jgi:prophage tail gpP-like protein
VRLKVADVQRPISISFTTFLSVNASMEVLTRSSKPGCRTLKNLFATRWSARAHACAALVESWNEIAETLKHMMTDTNEKPATRQEVTGLLKSHDTTGNSLHGDTVSFPS